MKIINRIIYALFVALIFMIIISFVRTGYIQSKLNAVGKEAFEEGNYNTFLPTRFYGEDLVINESFNINDEQFTLLGYEVITTYSKGVDSKVSDDGIFFIIIGNKNSKVNSFDINLKSIETDKSTEEKPKYYFDINTVFERYSKDLPIYITKRVDKKSYFVRSEFMKDETEYKLNTLSINDDIKYDLNFGLEDFTLKEILETYIKLEGDIPKNDIVGAKLNDPVYIDANIPMIITLVVFIIIIIPITYFVFKAKKHLGGKSPTTGLEKDLEKIKK